MKFPAKLQLTTELPLIKTSVLQASAGAEFLHEPLTASGRRPCSPQPVNSHQVAIEPLTQRLLDASREYWIAREEVNGENAKQENLFWSAQAQTEISGPPMSASKRTTNQVVSLPTSAQENAPRSEEELNHRGTEDAQSLQTLWRSVPLWLSILESGACFEINCLASCFSAPES